MYMGCSYTFLAKEGDRQRATGEKDTNADGQTGARRISYHKENV